MRALHDRKQNSAIMRYWHFSNIEDNKMAWKNLKQRSLADDLMIDHLALEELDDVNNLIDW